MAVDEFYGCIWMVEIKKTLVNKGFVEVSGVWGNLFYILDLLSHLLDEYFQLHTGGGDIG